MLVANQKYDSASSLLSFLEKERNFSISAPIDIDRIAEELGIFVKYENSLEDKESVGEIMFDDGNPIVRISLLKNSYKPRMRFTLAHEIGHYCLHSSSSRKGFVDSQSSMSRTESYWDSYESAANNFAAQLLMPKSLLLDEGLDIIEKLNAENGSVSRSSFIDSMAEKFEVSNRAMEYRLKNIGI